MNQALAKRLRWLALPLLGVALWLGWKGADSGGGVLPLADDPRLSERPTASVLEATVCEPGSVPGGAPVPELGHSYSPLFYPNRVAEKEVILPVTTAAAGLNSPDGSVEEDLSILGVLIQEYRRAYGAVPQGDGNYEMVMRMQGRNAKGIVVLPTDHASVDAEGELLDRWGSPYFFHTESAALITVRSAGPDQQLFTADDVVSEGGLTEDEGLGVVSQR